MIDRDRYERWFKSFCASYYEGNEGHDRNYRLKEEHTFRVCENVLRITSSEGVSGELGDLAWLSGLFHDLGRFPQYRQYRTFKDSVSVNHGLLSSQIVEAAVQDLATRQIQTLVDVLRFHNAYQIPPELDEPERLFCLKVLRDADKIDIWKVVVDYYTSDGDDRPSALGLGFPDEPTYSETAISGIFEKRLLRLSDIRTLNDFKMLQLSWVFDLNFRESFRIFHERGFLEKIGGFLPKHEDIYRVIDFLEDYVKGHI